VSTYPAPAPAASQRGHIWDIAPVKVFTHSLALMKYHQRQISESRCSNLIYISGISRIERYVTHIFAHDSKAIAQLAGFGCAVGARSSRGSGPAAGAAASRSMSTAPAPALLTDSAGTAHVRKATIRDQMGKVNGGAHIGGR